MNDRPVRTFAAAALALIAIIARPAMAGTLSEVVFSTYSPLSSNTELARRMLTPLTAAKLPQLLAGSGKTLSAQPVDLAQEMFLLFVPSGKPSQGYGLLVFVPPWRAGKMPEGWADVLDEDGVIFVSAENSGNDASPLGRREPLAVLAEQNVVARYPVDPEHIFAGGFSGGSRIALRVALGYPDLFRGAMLDAGSDPIGNASAPIPPKDLFVRFQEKSQIVFLTGDHDIYIRQTDLASMHSLQDWCVFNLAHLSISGTGHDSAPASDFARALGMLLRPQPLDSAQLAPCRASVAAQMDAQLQSAQSFFAAGRRDEARTQLNAIDARFGSLAAPQTIELAQALAAQ